MNIKNFLYKKHIFRKLIQFYLKKEKPKLTQKIKDNKPYLKLYEQIKTIFPDSINKNTKYNIFFKKICIKNRQPVKYQDAKNIEKHFIVLEGNGTLECGNCVEDISLNTYFKIPKRANKYSDKIWKISNSSDKKLELLKIISKENKENIDYVDLWKYFEDRADKVKLKLWTMSIWLLGIQSVILGFMFKGAKPILSIDNIFGNKFINNNIAYVFSTLGMLISVFGILLIMDFIKHIRRNWDRSTNAKDKDKNQEELDEIIDISKNKWYARTIFKNINPLTPTLSFVIYLLIFLFIILRNLCC